MYWQDEGKGDIQLDQKNSKIKWSWRSPKESLHKKQKVVFLSFFVFFNGMLWW
jgi:hypothetical protein